MVDNSNMPNPKCLGSHKNLGTEPKICEKGPKLGFEYLPTSKTSHCVRTACMAFPRIPNTAWIHGSIAVQIRRFARSLVLRLRTLAAESNAHHMSVLPPSRMPRTC